MLLLITRDFLEYYMNRMLTIRSFTVQILSITLFSLLEIGIDA